MSRRYNRPRAPAPSCKNHPNQAAVRGGLCANCLGWDEERKAMEKNLKAAGSKK
jgi:hypothetical protein